MVPFYTGCDFFSCVIDLRKVLYPKVPSNLMSSRFAELGNKSKVWMKEALRKTRRLG